MSDKKLDIVDRLRDPGAIVYNDGKIQTIDCMEAAELIERLRGALTRLGSTEGFVYAGVLDASDPVHQELQARVEFARTALGVP